MKVKTSLRVGAVLLLFLFLGGCTAGPITLEEDGFSCTVTIPKGWNAVPNGDTQALKKAIPGISETSLPSLLESFSYDGLLVTLLPEGATGNSRCIDLTVWDIGYLPENCQTSEEMDADTAETVADYLAGYGRNVKNTKTEIKELNGRIWAVAAYEDGSTMRYASIIRGSFVILMISDLENNSVTEEDIAAAEDFLSSITG